MLPPNVAACKSIPLWVLGLSSAFCFTVLCSCKQDSLYVDEDMNCGHNMVQLTVCQCAICHDVIFSLHWDRLFVRVIEMEVT